MIKYQINKIIFLKTTTVERILEVEFKTQKQAREFLKELGAQPMFKTAKRPCIFRKDYGRAAIEYRIFKKSDRCKMFLSSSDEMNFAKAFRGF